MLASDPQNLLWHVGVHSVTFQSGFGDCAILRPQVVVHQVWLASLTLVCIGLLWVRILPTCQGLNFAQLVFTHHGCITDGADLVCGSHLVGVACAWQEGQDYRAYSDIVVTQKSRYECGFN